MEFILKKSPAGKGGFNIKIEIGSGYQDVCERAGAMLSGAIKKKLLENGQCKLGIACGVNTIRGALDTLLRYADSDGVNWEDVKVFQLDELGSVPLATDGVHLEQPEPAALARFLNENFLTYTRGTSVWRPAPQLSGDFPGEAERLERELIREEGGLDIVFLGQGPQGAVSLYGMPASSDMGSGSFRTLPDVAVRPDFAGYAFRPGLRLLTQAEKCVLLSAGADRAAGLRQLILGEVVPEVPVTGLRSCRDLTVFATAQAARLLK